MRLPVALQLLFNALVAVVSSIWFYRSWKRSALEYVKESLAHSFRRQLQKLPLDFSEFLPGRGLEQLQADELYVLAKVLPHVRQQDHLSIYKGMLQEGLEQGRFEECCSWQALKPIREKLGLTDENHYQILSELSSQNPNLGSHW